jgi:hypothetical protein
MYIYVYICIYRYIYINIYINTGMIPEGKVRVPGAINFTKADIWRADDENFFNFDFIHHIIFFKRYVLHVFMLDIVRAMYNTISDMIIN